MHLAAAPVPAWPQAHAFAVRRTAGQGRAGLLVDAFLGAEDRPPSRVPSGASTLGDAQAAIAYQALTLAGAQRRLGQGKDLKLQRRRALKDLPRLRGRGNGNRKPPTRGEPRAGGHGRGLPGGCGGCCGGTCGHEHRRGRSL